MLSHEEARSLVSGYVLLALDRDERRDLEEHLKGCDDCAAALREMAGVASSLPLALEEREPPPQLRGRVMAAIKAEKGKTVPAPPSLPARSVFWGPARALFRRPAALATAGATLALIVGLGVGLGLWNAHLNSRLDATQARLSKSYEAMAIMALADRKWQLGATEVAPTAGGVLGYSSGRDASSLLLWGLPLDAEKAYLAWTIKGGEKTKVGTMWPQDAGLWIVIPGDAHSYDAVGVTVREVTSPEPKDVLVASVSLAGS